MSEQEVTFSTVRFQKSSGLQNRVRLEETLKPRKAGLRVFHYGQQKHERQEFLNHHNNCSIMQSDIKLKDELLKKKSIECNLLESLNRDQNRLYNKTKTVLDFLQHTGRGVKVYWFCYGMKCYYFVMDRKPWSRCKQTCQSSSLSLLKIDDEDELVLQTLTCPFIILDPVSKPE
uniref:Ly49-like N-terminal domain-containing protein n=1 Tax=Mus spicilegus TaxID=10103 RepID=A0A8C6I5G9_MUSSI